MKRRTVISLFLVTPVAGLLSLSLTRAADVPRPEERLNVLFIAVDDLRTSLGCYGDAVAQTPHIDALALSGLLFTRAYCQQAVCNPSRQSLLSGRRPDSIRVWNLVDHFRETAPDVVPLPELFKRQGWFAQSFGKIYHGSAGMSDPPSWSVPEQFHNVSKSDDYLLAENQRKPGQSGTKMTSHEAADVDDDAYRDGQVATRAIAAMGENAYRPFFLAIGFRKPHLPFSAPKKYWDRYNPETIPLPDPASAPQNAPEVAAHDWRELRGYLDIPGKGSLTAAKIQQLRHGYYAAMSYTDAQIGRVLDELDRLGLREKTIVVLWSDHGFHLGEQDLWAKDTNYELATRVPLILRVPGLTRHGARTDALVELVDLYPTLADLCGIPPPPKLDGVSLRPLLSNPDARVKEFALSQFPRPWQHNGQPRNMGYALRTGHWRYVEWIDFAARHVLARELYDLTNDARERVNLAGEPEHAETVAQLSRQLNAAHDPKMKAQPGRINGGDLAPRAGDPGESGKGQDILRNTAKE